MKNDEDIVKSVKLLSVDHVAARLGIDSRYITHCGDFKAKINPKILDSEEIREKKDGNLILVTATTPTPYGEGKTTVSIGLSDAINKLGYKSIVTLREPSMGPVFGIKGGATGGGYAQVVPMEDINLHFTGDFHAVTIAHNLISAIIDNHLQHGNEIGMDIREITWKRVVDLNDRALRKIVVGLGGSSNGFPREDGFDITPASEIMAILGLSMSYTDLKERISKIVVGYTKSGVPVRVSDLKVQGAVAALLRDAFKPNMVQSLENNPAFIHTGPFANIAHGTNSIIATKMALKLADFVVTEAGFGTDLGGEKYVDIVSRIGNLRPKAAVLVTSVRALKYHGGVKRQDFEVENIGALRKGFENLDKHMENLDFFNIPFVVAVNRFPSDTEKELDEVVKHVVSKGKEVSVVEVWSEGSEGGLDLARKIVNAAEKTNGNLNYVYDPSEPVREKIEKVARNIYGAKEVIVDRDAERDIKNLEKHGFENLFVCIAKTQLSLSGDPRLIGRPADFSIHIREVRLSAGAGFVVPIAGEIMTMPGLPKVPTAESIDITEDGRITGLF
ncbi:MAG TPA: formate--tetrahydrofolate ligase [Candidatus Hydrothermia bacterium]|nr:formate--tetrahydrofolate ligase [Candidatus Hydrothermia bacterium]HOL24318.1 formate--tetrahydrofolate ligase [Candidatus Hydrothermia bacterium]HOP32819.1 formate--tetrahydrofolate ligase [Candidatus Hydrothermia bacterium]HPO79378.1 formate--tetrahydrofolate ligase [Candidatus Hydrothermia bacterium]HRD23556.1 formate--tetrahydrofolate ligase [Candidatus Hydrothermia bacterium]